MGSVWLTVLALALVQLGLAALLLQRTAQAFRTRIDSVNELAALALVLAGTLWVAHPYIHDGQVGAGDSYHYGLQVADFVTQLRAGVFPILIGQSDYAFNGNVHTVRTAPYFTLFAGLLDFATFRQLSFFALQNLTAVLSLTAAAFSAYVVTRILAPARLWSAAALAFLYVASPAFGAALFSSDMFATVMTFPWLPLFMFGLVRSLRDLDDTRALLLSVTSLAAIWYGHPAIGAWLTLPMVGVHTARVLLIGGAPGNLVRPALGALLFGGLAAYLLYSVHSLDLGYYEAAHSNDARTSVLASLVGSVPGVFLPVAPTAEGTVSFQLGYSLTAALLLGLVLSRGPGWIRVGLLAITCGIVVLTLPLPGVTALVWSLIPDRLIDVTNVWPMQRFYPILSAVALVTAAVGLGSTKATSPRSRMLLAGSLIAAVAWSGLESTKFQRRAKHSTLPKEESLTAISPENAKLTRSSYLLFGFQPPAYSHGWVDPEFASRLLDETARFMTDNSTALLAAEVPLTTRMSATPLGTEVPVTIPAGSETLLRFTFAAPEAAGELTLRGSGIYRNYSLPQSGEPKALGAGPEANRTLTIRPRSSGERTVMVASSAPGVSVETLDFTGVSRPVALKSLTPYTATVTAPRAGYLETPQVFVPGYAAWVDGQPVAVDRTTNGLVAVPIPSGTHEVVIRYPGPPGLRGLWLLAAVLGVTSLSVLGFATRHPRPQPAPITRESLRAYNLVTWWQTGSSRRNRGLLAATAVATLVALIAVTVNRASRDQAAFGSLRLTVELPETRGGPEPLVISGKTGAADCLYIVYEPDGRVRFGLDHWGIGGPLSEPIALAPARFHTIELTAGGLFPRNHPDSAQFNEQVRPGTRAPLGPTRLVVDGVTIMDLHLPFHPAGPAEVSLGKNSIGISVCGPRFTGRIVNSDRFLPSFFR